MTGCAQGAMSQLAIEPGSVTHTFDASSERYEFLHETLQDTPTRVRSNGINGTRSRKTERTRVGTYLQSGGIAFNPDPVFLDNWLPRILGATASGTTFAVSESLPDFGILIDRVTGTFQYNGCKVNTAIFSGSRNAEAQEPQPIQVDISPMWTGYADSDTSPAASAFPTIALATAANTYPYVFEEGVLVFNGTEYEFKKFQLVIHNFLQPRWVNSRRPTRLCPGDRLVQLQCLLPYDLAFAVTNKEATLSGSLKFTNGAMSCLFSFAGLEFANPGPNVRGKTEIDVPVVARAATVTTTKEIIVTNDSSA
jgi:hypothetical protein